MIFQIIFNKQKNIYEIKQVDKPVKDAYKNYQFHECEDAEGTYLKNVLDKTEGFCTNYIKNFDDCTNF